MSPLRPSSTVEVMARQIWSYATATSSASVSDCYAYRLHRGGFIVINQTLTIPLTIDAFLEPPCSTVDDPNSPRQILNNAILDVKDASYPAISPVLFVLGICLTVAWVLLIMLLITPRTFFHGGPGYGVGQMRTGTSGGSIPIVGIGSRPWFQKFATFTVAVSLLIAAVRTFKVAENQYNSGYQDSLLLTAETMDSVEILIVRYISTTFEWLAQAQTSLRLFQRHREKVVIKWVALTLILLENVFVILNSFTPLKVSDSDIVRSRQPRYSHAIPALQYLFEIALSLLYAGVVFYYSLRKRRFAYYHPKMKNISLVALLASCAVLVPVVFFVLDITVNNVMAWGDYVRWVGAAAASVIVWEWVERIEALERDERKDGILGREIFEGDEMLDNDPANHGSYKTRKRKLGKSDSAGTTVVASSRDSGSSLKRRTEGRRPRFLRLDKGILAKIAALREAKKAKSKLPAPEDKGVELTPAPQAARRPDRKQVERAALRPAPRDGQIQPPQIAPSPLSRSDCTSASTVYRVVHHPISPTSTPGISEMLYPNANAMNVASPSPDNTKGRRHSSDLLARRTVDITRLNPFRRRGNAHTPETLETASDNASDEVGRRRDNRPDPRGVGGGGGGGFLSRLRRNPSEEPELPPLVIPWRGDDGNASPDVDLETGLAIGSTNAATSAEPGRSGDDVPAGCDDDGGNGNGNDDDGVDEDGSVDDESTSPQPQQQRRDNSSTWGYASRSTGRAASTARSDAGASPPLPGTSRRRPP